MTSTIHDTSEGRRLVVGLLTPLGQGGISIIELAGPGTLALLDRLFAGRRGQILTGAEPGRLLYGKLVQDGDVLDEVIVECTEDEARECAVINCHGGVVASARVLDALCALGAREVSPEELMAARHATGSISRIQLEVAGLIPDAPSLRAAGMLLDQYGGALERALDAVDRLAAADKAAPPCAAMLQQLLSTASFGRGLLDPLRVVVAGRPNVGKSTLVNALLRFERVIVHATAGTTRDAIEDLFAIHGVPFRIVDTAGIRKPGSEVEWQGVRRGLNELSHADIAILIFDGSGPLQPEDERTMCESMPAKVIVVTNKSDLPQRLEPGAVAQGMGQEPLAISAATGQGIAALEERILAAAYPAIPKTGEAVVFTERQETLVRQALEALSAGDIAATLDLLKRITGPDRPGGPRPLSQDA